MENHYERMSKTEKQTSFMRTFKNYSCLHGARSQMPDNGEYEHKEKYRIFALHSSCGKQL